MICKEGTIDVISIGGGGGGGGNNIINSNGTVNHQYQQSNGGIGHPLSGHNTLQHRRKSQLITFSASSCDIKNSLSHEVILINSSNASNGGGGGRGSIVGSISNGSNGAGVGVGVGGGGNARLSFAEEDIMIVANGGGGGSASVSAGSGSGGSGSGNDADLEDDVFRRRSLEVEDGEEEECIFDEEYGTRIEILHNANDDSGGGSYEDSHAMHSSIAGSNRNSLEKDDDDMDADVISTDVSCYDQLLGSSCNTRNDEDDIATLVGDGDAYTKLCKGGGLKSITVTATTTAMTANALNGVSSGVGGGVGVGENGGIIYANPFMDDEGIAESGM